MRYNNDHKFLNSAICIAVILNIIVFGIFSSVLFRYRYYRNVWGLEVLKVATTSNPVTMDPCDSWDSVSNDILDQVVETLIAYKLSDPEFPLVGRLAESWYWSDNTTIVFQLRPNVFFHDGSLLTGDNVIHTFTRINFFGNASGTLTDPHHMAFPHSLYKFPGKPPGLTPIFNHTLSFVNPTDNLEVTLVMNGPFAPAEGLLAYTASSIVPQSTPVDAMLELGTDLAIGTGPFKLVSYVPNSETRFERWDDYWDTPAFWDELVYVHYSDAVAANNAMLAGDIDYLGQGITALKEYFEASPYITVTGDGVNDFINGSIYWYIAFNSEIINITWRKAISSAFNYTYLNEEIDEGTTVKANSLVPPGFPAHNASVKGGVFNIPYARLKMQSMGFGVGWELGSQVGDEFTPGANESLWKAAAWVPDVGNFTNNQFNFLFRQGSHWVELLIARFQHDMDLIGIEINIQILTWNQFIVMCEHYPDRLHIYYLGRGPDYFETFNMIDPLVNPASSSNFARINNSQINMYLDLAASETDTETRYGYYMKLQYLIMDKYAYHMGIRFDKLYHVHAATLKGFPYNCMRNLYWYPTYRDY